MGINIALPMTIYEDNQACIRIADNPVSQRRTRHIDVRFHFVRDYINDGYVSVKYCRSKEMLADIMTKIMDRSTFSKLRDKIISDVSEFIGDDIIASIS